jgi:glycosidase
LLAKKQNLYKKGYQMMFTSNHDENSWAGTEFERMGKGHKAFAVLTATMTGIPLVYTGQESAMDKQLQFFVKDSIPWSDYGYTGFYTTLFDLKHKNKALWNGSHGGEMVRVHTGNDAAVYAFTREKDGDKVLVMVNLSSSSQSCKATGLAVAGLYSDAFSGAKVVVAENQEISLGPWEYVVLTNK